MNPAIAELVKLLARVAVQDYLTELEAQHSEGRKQSVVMLDNSQNRGNRGRNRSVGNGRDRRAQKQT
jgi:hypothetical protein